LLKVASRSFIPEYLSSAGLNGDELLSSSASRNRLGTRLTRGVVGGAAEDDDEDAGRGCGDAIGTMKKREIEFWNCSEIPNSEILEFLTQHQLLRMGTCCSTHDDGQNVKAETDNGTQDVKKQSRAYQNYILGETHRSDSTANLMQLPEAASRLTTRTSSGRHRVHHSDGTLFF